MKLSYLFSDGMVLQRGKKNYIWGETSPEIIVAGILDGKKFNTKADTHGMFVAELPDLPVGGPYCMEINGDEKRVIRNIMSGDVFLLGGLNIYSDSLGGQLKALIDIRDGCNGEIESYAKNDDGTYKTDIDGNIVTETNAQAGENINYKGVPYYQVQLNTFIQTFAQAVNSIFESGYVSDADTTDAKNKGIPLFVVQDGSGVLTATTVSVNSALLEDADKLATKSNVGDGESQCDLIEQINALQKKKIFDGGTGAYFLESIVSDVSIDSSKAKTFLSNYNNMKTTIQNQRLSVMGVDTDEEAMDLMKFQQAYNLNSKMMSVMNEIYDKLINQTGL